MSVIGDALKLTTVPQRVALGVVAVSLTAAMTYNVVQAFENRRLAAEVSKLSGKINDPETGFVVRLTQARANVATCEGSVQRQTAALKDQSQRDRATALTVQARYDIEHAARIRAEKAAAAFLARKPQGATIADRVADVDAQVLGDLK